MIKTCAFCGNKFENHRGTYCSRSCSGKASGFKTGVKPPRHNKGCHCNRCSGFPVIYGKTPWNKGIKFDAIRGNRHWNWQGGKPKKVRGMTYEENRKYKDWRKEVFKRDDWMCQFCGKRGGILHADHVNPWIAYPKLRFELSNGRTLCAPCHRKTDTYSRHASYYGNVVSAI